MANKYGDYNMEVIKRHYEADDLHQLWLMAQVASEYISDGAESLMRKSGTLYPWLRRLAEDLKDLADAAHDAQYADEFPELCRR